MISSPIRLIVAVAFGAVVAPAFAWQTAHSGPARLYIETFATTADADKLREDLTAELRKTESVMLVADEASADLILGGGGEIWIRGYRSFSPRSHMKLPTNGTPIYGGYLSVELRNRQGVTVWSYLATPGAAADDVSKDLAKQIAKHLPEGLKQAETPLPPFTPSEELDALTGAGATFPQPVYRKWFTNFHAVNPASQITYEAIGSEAGVRKLLEGGVDFGASDSPEILHDIAPGEESTYLLFPSVVGAVVPIVNLPGFTGIISLTPEALAGIYLGRIKKWNDPILREANRSIQLPDLDIVVVHRRDGSGTSYTWTDFLSKTNSDWKAQIGASLDPKWPVGRAANGNDGVAKMVKELGGSIGYVEFIYALENHLSFARVRNQKGEFVAADLTSIAAAADSAVMSSDFKTSITDAPGAGAYPITSFTWFVVPAHIADDAKRSNMTAFLRWMLSSGQRQAAALGYLALPASVVSKEEAAISRIH